MKKILSLFGLFITIMFLSYCTKNVDTSGLKNPDFSKLNQNYAEVNQFLAFFGGPCDFCPQDFSKFVDNNKAALGRVLFYDTRLSQNNSLSCGTCHIQSLGFADGLEKSIGFNGKKTVRHSMAISNLANMNGFFWDNSRSTLADQSLRPVKNHLEMGLEDMKYLTEKLKSTIYYPGLFFDAFGDAEITEARIGEAMSNFLTSMFSFNSKFSQNSNIGFNNFTPIEKQGLALFFSQQYKCGTCHSTSLSLDNGRYEDPIDPFTPNAQVPGSNIGLDNTTTDMGNGQGKFKIPGLNNITVTAPYMHDGRFQTLDEVLDHYSHGIKNNPVLDGRLKDKHGKAITMNFTTEEKRALIAFLATLTDQKYLTDPKFSDPFKK